MPPLREAGLPAGEPVAFTTSDGLRLEGWYIRPAAPPTGQTVVVFNGNGGNRASRVPLASALAARGLACFLFDYRGYGGNPGLPSEEGLARDARAAWSAISSLDEGARLVYFGESLGAAVALRLAVEHPPEALILRSPFASLASVGRIHYPFLPLRWLLRDRYPSIDRIPDLRTPLLVIAGTADEIVPLDESERLFAAAPEPKWMLTVEDADHNDAELSYGVEIVDAVVAFLGEVRAGRAAPVSPRKRETTETP